RYETACEEREPKKVQSWHSSVLLPARGWPALGLSMDDVMSHPRMIGQLSEDFLQDRASFLLFGVAGVAWRRVRDYLQGIEKSRFAVVGICRIQLLHGFLIVQSTSSRSQSLRLARAADTRGEVLVVS